MKRIKKLLLISFLLLVLSGCWDEKEIGEVNYATAMAIDYQDENYIIYVQILDFSNVAKQDVNKPAQQVPLYIGRAKGKTVNDAVNNLYHTSQQMINWAHVGAVIYTQSVIEKGVTRAEQSLRKNGQFRYTPWMFGTKESIDDILSATGFFQLPPVYTILYKPTDTYTINSYIRPIRMHKFVSIYKEPGGTALLPALSIDETDWKESVVEPKPKKTLKVNGVFPIHNGKGKEWLSHDELPGLRWTNNDTKNTTIDVVEDDQIKGTVRIMKPHVEFSVEKKGSDFQFSIHVKAVGSLSDMEEQLSVKKIEKLVKKQIKKEITETYLNGINKGVDVYNIKNKLFHQRVKPKDLAKYPLKAESLHKITVDFHLETKGVYE
ncbi:MAG: Ger(x)C family spore germination protein [Bacillota bacterium]|uniref:Ger(X)C family spore germination protein n=1 Tax=Virgibacillus salarius TaxID=447199 RepID=A0A941DX34_9BACI|nr:MULTISPECIES: Ger(x)C family spore germination protein [Virgibacillus]NAZ07785.1 Ger(x)C family spore germination protein [Agaribacter marinus]MBR7795068.1 Ger(x)C family spore germination protein [Virgibacillus salarius]MCC2248428.1 Ger(x)C family spore germination protein [Virgibacillus sp. AGTR]MDY7043139.1 Ger(x)C family spore germination protein [Virgibacillus sp. M23]QRZ16708.1 Ger(x)C family spore germination protein [Virgibacillus sp. AGTR]